MWLVAALFLRAVEASEYDTDCLFDTCTFAMRYTLEIPTGGGADTNAWNDVTRETCQLMHVFLQEGVVVMSKAFLDDLFSGSRA